jgi:alpha-glucosidase (family GH31 glycosyl hydrolase)
MCLQFAWDPSAWSMANSDEPQTQYMFGADFLVAPVLTEGASEVSVYLPQYSGPWIHLVSTAYSV